MASETNSKPKTPNSKANWDLRFVSWKLLAGLTLLEVLIGLSIVGFIATLVISIYFAHFRLFSNQNTSLDVATQNKIALDEVTNQIRESQSVVTTCPNCGSDTTGSGVLVLRLWPQDASGEPFDPGSTIYDYIVYKLDPSDYTRFLKKIVADPASSRKSSEKIIAVNISNLQFTYNSADVTQASEITVTITTSAKSLNKTHTNTQSSKASLRNK